MVRWMAWAARQVILTRSSNIEKTGLYGLRSIVLDDDREGV